MDKFQEKELLALIAEMIIEQRRLVDKVESLQDHVEKKFEVLEQNFTTSVNSLTTEIRHFADVTKTVLKNHETRIINLEHE